MSYEVTLLHFHLSIIRYFTDILSHLSFNQIIASTFCSNCDRLEAPQDTVSWATIWCALYTALVIVWGIVHRNHAPPAPAIEHLDIAAADGSLNANEGYDEEVVHDWNPEFENYWHEWLDLALPPSGGGPEE